MRVAFLTSAAVAASCALFAARADAQGPIVAEPGARLRITIASGHQRMDGQFVRPKPDSLEFLWWDSQGDRLQQLIALTDIARIEISHGRSHPYVATALKGSAIGIAFGLVAGIVTACWGANSGCLWKPESGTFGLGLGAVGFSIGFVRAAKGFDRWVPATVPGWNP